MSQSLFSSLGVPYTAVALANAFVDATGEEREPVVALVRRASDQLASAGTPTAWQHFDPEQFFAELGVATRHQRTGMALRLLGFFHWLWLVGLIEPSQAAAISSSIIDVAPRARLLDDLYDSLQADRAGWMNVAN